MAGRLPTIKQKMLLFSAEYGRYPYLYRLYFVELDTLHSGEPKIHCLRVRRRKEFFGMILGGVYTLRYKDITLEESSLEDQYHLSDADYFFLCEMRDMRFTDDRTHRFIHSQSQGYEAKDFYYTFDTARKLFDYRPSQGKNALVWILKLSAYLLSIVIPCFMYFLALYASTYLAKWDGPLALRSLAVPVMAICVAPFMIWLMYLIYTMSEVLLLNIEYSRTVILRLYFLRWAGMRKSCFVEPLQRRRLFRTGVLAGSILLVGIIFAILAF